MSWTTGNTMGANLLELRLISVLLKLPVGLAQRAILEANAMIQKMAGLKIEDMAIGSMWEAGILPLNYSRHLFSTFYSQSRTTWEHYGNAFPAGSVAIS